MAQGQGLQARVPVDRVAKSAPTLKPNVVGVIARSSPIYCPASTHTLRRRIRPFDRIWLLLLTC